MTTITTICLAGLGLAGLLCMARLVRSESFADRIVALDTLLVVVVSVVAVLIVRTGSTAFVSVPLVVALLGFVGTVTVARFMERRGV